MATLIGQQRGNFKLTQLLGQGGFAEVYLGENIYAQNNKVAIKILNTHLDEKGVRQFTGEANTLTSLRHPHIIQVTDFGFDNNIPYLIMEYAPNGSLANSHPVGKPLPIATVVAYIKQVADALQYAHNNKIIHRDVKPANMLIGANKSILLSDFGIARVVQTYSIGTKDIAGSFEYMSPEQGTAGAGAIFASDQYSLGVVAYQWLCGNLPFQGDSYQLMYQHRMDPPPPFPEALQISPSVENVIKKALAKDPQQRFANIQTFASTLEQASKGIVFSEEMPSPNKAPQPGKPPTQTQPSQLSSNIDIDALYRQGVEAYAKGEEYRWNPQKVKDFFEQAEQSWQQTLTIDSNYMSGTLKTRFTNLQQRLHPIRVQELRRQAEDHRRAGRWQEAIQTWETLLKLEPENAEAQKNIETARHNMQYAGMYATAQRLVQEGKFTAAKAELAELKIYVDDYPDPQYLAYTIEREIDRPIREVQVKKKTDTSLNNFILSVFLLPCGVSGLVVSIFIKSIPVAILIAVAIAIILAIFFIIGLRKPHALPNSRLVATFTVGAIVTVGLAALIPWLQLTFNFGPILRIFLFFLFTAMFVIGIIEFLSAFGIGEEFWQWLREIYR